MFRVEPLGHVYGGAIGPCLGWSHWAMFMVEKLDHVDGGEIGPCLWWSH